MREKAAEFRNRGEELHQAAEKAAVPEGKRRLLESAAEFLSLADKMERAADPTQRLKAKDKDC
jgi:hypothetical protein